MQTLNDKGLSIATLDSCEIQIFTDASAMGYGGYVSLCSGGKPGEYVDSLCAGALPKGKDSSKVECNCMNSLCVGTWMEGGDFPTGTKLG